MTHGRELTTGPRNVKDTGRRSASDIAVTASPDLHRDSHGGIDFEQSVSRSIEGSVRAKAECLNFNWRTDARVYVRSSACLLVYRD
jgi:hypothetical protein